MDKELKNKNIEDLTENLKNLKSFLEDKIKSYDNEYSSLGVLHKDSKNQVFGKQVAYREMQEKFYKLFPELKDYSEIKKE